MILSDAAARFQHKFQLKARPKHMLDAAVILISSFIESLYSAWHEDYIRAIITMNRKTHEEAAAGQEGLSIIAFISSASGYFAVDAQFTMMHAANSEVISAHYYATL